MSVLKGKHMLIMNISFTCIFIIHIFSIWYNIKHPDYPGVRTLLEDLKDVDFPVSFKMCLTELANSSKRYEKVGYHDELDFFWGRSKFNSNLIGWNGHTEEGSTYGSIKG